LSDLVQYTIVTGQFKETRGGNSIVTDSTILILFKTD
jgi:hypothetical protein